MTLHRPAEECCQTLGQFCGRGGQVGGFVMFGQKLARQVGHTHPDRGLVERGKKDRGAARGKAHQTRGAAPRGGAEFAFVHQPQIAQHRQAIRHHGAAEFALAFKFLPRVGGTRADEVQEFDQRWRSGFHRARPSLAAGAGRFGKVGSGQGQGCVLMGFARDTGATSAVQEKTFS